MNGLPAMNTQPPASVSAGADAEIEVTDEMLVAAMRAFESMSSVLRYREKDKWHTCDMVGMRHAIQAAIRAATPSDEVREASSVQQMSYPRHGIYIASKTRHAGRWLAMRDAGAPIISTWIDEAGEGQSADLDDLWQRCLSEACTCAVLIVYKEPEDALKGAWVEMGAALARGTPVFAVGLREYTIANYRGVRHFDTIEDAFGAWAIAFPPASTGTESSALSTTGEKKLP